MNVSIEPNRNNNEKVSPHPKFFVLVALVLRQQLSSVFIKKPLCMLWEEMKKKKKKKKKKKGKEEEGRRRRRRNWRKLVLPEYRGFHGNHHKYHHHHYHHRRHHRRHYFLHLLLLLPLLLLLTSPFLIIFFSFLYPSHSFIKLLILHNLPDDAIQSWNQQAVFVVGKAYTSDWLSEKVWSHLTHSVKVKLVLKKMDVHTIYDRLHGSRETALLKQIN